MEWESWRYTEQRSVRWYEWFSCKLHGNDRWKLFLYTIQKLDLSFWLVTHTDARTHTHTRTPSKLNTNIQWNVCFVYHTHRARRRQVYPVRMAFLLSPSSALSLPSTRTHIIAPPAPAYPSKLCQHQHYPSAVRPLLVITFDYVDIPYILIIFKNNKFHPSWCVGEVW